MAGTSEVAERGDAFGRALVDWQAGRTDPEILERDDGTKDEGAGYELYLAPPAKWPGSERHALRQVRGRVLDLGCGAGRVALHLQRAGVDVVGLDSSSLALRAARARGVERLWHVPVGRLGRRIRAFDTIVLFGNNFGMFGTPARVRRTFERWAAWTGPDTRILAQSTTPYCGGAPLIDRRYYRRNVELGRMPGQVRLRISYRRWVTPWFDWFFASRSDMRELLRCTGWRLRRVFGTNTAEPYVALLEKST